MNGLVMFGGNQDGDIQYNIENSTPFLSANGVRNGTNFNSQQTFQPGDNRVSHEYSNSNTMMPRTINGN